MIYWPFGPIKKAEWDGTSSLNVGQVCTVAKSFGKTAKIKTIRQEMACKFV